MESDGASEAHELQAALLSEYFIRAKIASAAHGAAEGVNRTLEKQSTLAQTTILSVLTLSHLGAWGFEGSAALMIFSGVLSFVGAIIGGFKSVYRYGAKEAAHHATAGNYADVAADIKSFKASDDYADHEERSVFATVTHEKLKIYDALATAIGGAYLDDAKAAINRGPFPQSKRDKKAD